MTRFCRFVGLKPLNTGAKGERLRHVVFRSAGKLYFQKIGNKLLSHMRLNLLHPWERMNRPLYGECISKTNSWQSSFRYSRVWNKRQSGFPNPEKKQISKEENSPRVLDYEALLPCKFDSFLDITRRSAVDTDYWHVSFLTRKADLQVGVFGSTRLRCSSELGHQCSFLRQNCSTEWQAEQGESVAERLLTRESGTLNQMANMPIRRCSDNYESVSMMTLQSAWGAQSFSEGIYSRELRAIRPRDIKLETC